MDKHDRFIAINQTLPGLEDFLKTVLGSEPLSEEANRQRIEFLRRLESVSRPPSLPPRPANLSEIYRARIQQSEAPSGSGSQDESNVYKNDRTRDPVEFASQQRELSRVATLYKTYVPQTVIFGEKGSRNGGLFVPRPGNTTRDGGRDSIVSSSSAEDDIYEHLSLKSVSPSDPVSTQDGSGSTKTEDSFVFPSPPKTPQEHSTSIYLPARSGSVRSSGGKGKLSTGWFKKETKLNEEVYVSNLREPVIKGYLKDIKANKRRWCVLHGNRLHIFKNQEDPAIMILYLPECNIGVDDKKKISYSFRLIPPDGPSVTLAIEDGHDLSPWMSAIMAAAVRRSSIDRPVSPLEALFTLEQARAERMRGAEVDGGIEEEEEEEEEDFYERPVDLSVSGTPSAHSTPATTESKGEEDEGYDAPLPPLPIDDDDSSSESSSDENESMEKKEEKAAAKKKIYDQIPPDLLAELTAGQHKGGKETNKSQDSICGDGSTNDQSLDFTDSHSEHSGNISNRHSYIEPIASDDTGSSEPKEENIESGSRKRTSTVLSISMESVCSDTEDPTCRTTSVTSETSVTSKGLGPKVKRRRKLVPAEAELQFLQDPTAMHSGILYQKRRLGVWSKRYCKIIDSRFKCYRNPADQKPSLNFLILGYDVSLIDNKESKKSYCIKISHPTQETYYFATDSRVSIERWIEVLSLAATGRLDVIAPYPPYFCAEQSGDELKSRSRESLLSSEGRLSDDDSVDTLDELDPPSERGHSLSRLQANEEQNRLAAEKTNTVLPNDTRNVEFSESVETQTKALESGAQQSPETGVKERTHKKRKEKPREGTKTPSTMSPPHSMFISESVDGQAKPEPMNEEYVSRPQGSAKESSEDSSPKKDRRWTETLKKKKLSRAHTYDYRLRENVTSSSHAANAKNKPLSMRRKNSQTFVHLMSLFDKEGRFCGYLTEVRYKHLGTTHLRRWCVVKNGVLILYNSESEDTPQGKLSLVDMWLTDKSDEARNKFAFTLEDKEGKETTLQTTIKEDFQKWMGVLELFTELRVERPQPEVADPLRKTDSYASEEGEGTFERGTLRTKSSRAAAKLKDEIYALAPGKVRTSLRMKLSQRVNVRDIFRKTHSSYDLEGGAPPEGSSLPEADIDTLAVFGGNLKQIEPNGSADSRWCTIKEKELLIFSDRKASDPLRKIPLLRSTFSDLSDDESTPNRIQIRFCNENILFDAIDKFDHNRWLRMLSSATERRNSSDDDRPKCVGRLTSPTFTKKKILHRRTRSEAFSQEGETPTSATRTREGSTSSTDRLMSGYLQEVRETNGARTQLRRWCVATSEKFIVYDNQNSKKASFEWELSEMLVQDQSDIDAGSFGFCVILGEEKLCFKVIDEDSARHWLSVLARYCHPVAANEPLFKPPPRKNSKEERRRSASDNDLKAKPAEKESNVLEVLSEGRASGRKLLRRATEDSTFFRKFNRSEMFKAPWRASTEKLEVKMRDRERSGRAAANKTLKRFSCGSLFDSDGKYSGHLMELITSELYSSQVRRWCVQKDDYLYVYENEATDNPIKVVPLFNAKVVDTSDIEACRYRFRIDYGEGNAVFFRALTRNDLEKWTTIISVKSAVLQDRSERQLRRSRTLSSEKSSSESEVMSPELKPLTSVTSDSASLNETVSIWSADSVFGATSDSVPITSGTSGSAGLKPVEPSDETGVSPVEQSSNEQPNDLSATERTASVAESSESDRKTVSRLSSIEDLSHIYENFLAFASAMAERSPEFQEQLYHVYENVTQALDNGGQGSTQSEGQITEELPEVQTAQETNESNELGSPSMEMSSEFEKISLRENEEKDSSYVYRYSGIYGESHLEKLVEDANENSQDSIDDVAVEESVEQSETNQDNEELSGGLEGETERAAVGNASRVDRELLEDTVISGGDEDLVNNDIVGESKKETGPRRNDNEIEEIQDVENDTDFIRVEDSVDTGDELNESENENEAVTSQSSLQDKSFGENQVEVNSMAHSSTSLVHADPVSAIETGESSLYLEEQINNQVWREIEGQQFSEPVFETNVLDAVRVSTPCDANSETVLDQDSFASAVEKSASSDDDEDKATNIEQQDSKDILEDTGDDYSNANDDERFETPEVSETFLPCFDEAEADNFKEKLQNSKRDIQGSIKTLNNADRILDVTPNLCAAESFESSSPPTLKCSKEAEARCEQTLASEVCEAEDAQIWEEAVTRVDESPSSTTQSYECESTVESSNNEVETRDLTSVDDSAEAQPDKICNDTNEEDTALDNNSESLSCNLSDQANIEDSNQATELNTAKTVETYFGSETISKFSEGSPAELNQLEENPAGTFAVSDEHAENFQSTEPEVYSDDFLGSEDNSSPQQDTEEPEDTLDEGVELEKRCSSSEGYYTPEDTIDLVRSDSIAEEDSETDSANNRTQNNNPELDGTEVKTDTTDLQTENEDVTTPSLEQCDELQKEHDLVREPETENESKDSQSQPINTWRNNTSLESTQDLTRSQMDILKAVTAAFEEILELHGEDSDTDDTRL
ncbi:uncharacterized protein LOC144656322 isoform X2 [Oculina patagonica]